MLVQEANAAAGEPLVTAAVGGHKGGGAQLTPRGKLSLEVFEQISGKVRETAAGLLQKVLSSPIVGRPYTWPRRLVCKKPSDNC